MKVNDAIVGALLALLGVVILVHVQSYPTIPGQQYGPAIFPGSIAAGLAICGALLIHRGLRAGGRAFTFAAWTRSPRHVGNFFAVLAALVFYIVAAEPLGFPIIGTLLLIALCWKFGVRLTVAIPVAIVATLLVHFLFYKVMRVPLPWGVLTPLAW